MFPELTKYICGKEVDIKQTIIEHLDQLAQKFVDYYETLSPTNENDWIIDTFAGTDLAELPLLVAEEFMDITAEPTNRIFLHPLKKNTRKTLQIQTKSVNRIFNLPGILCDYPIYV